MKFVRIESIDQDTMHVYHTTLRLTLQKMNGQWWENVRPHVMGDPIVIFGETACKLADLLVTLEGTEDWSIDKYKLAVLKAPLFDWAVLDREVMRFLSLLCLDQGESMAVTHAARPPEPVTVAASTEDSTIEATLRRMFPGGRIVPFDGPFDPNG